MHKGKGVFFGFLPQVVKSSWVCEGLKINRRWGRWGWGLGGWVGCWGWESDYEVVKMLRMRIVRGWGCWGWGLWGVRRVRRLSWGQLGMGGGRVEHVTDGPDHNWDHFCEHLCRLSMKADDITWYQENTEIITFWKATFEKSQPVCKITKRPEQGWVVTKNLNRPKW